jgi:hypothetical protein
MAQSPPLQVAPLFTSPSTTATVVLDYTPPPPLPTSVTHRPDTRRASGRCRRRLFNRRLSGCRHVVLTASHAPEIGREQTGHDGLRLAAVRQSVLLPPVCFCNSLSMYAGLCVFIYMSSPTYLQQLGWCICVLYAVGQQSLFIRCCCFHSSLPAGGTGRAVFESTNKAILADAFPAHKDAAFAAATAASGGSAALAFFVFPHLDKGAMVLITGVAAVISLAALFPVRRMK